MLLKRGVGEAEEGQKKKKKTLFAVRRMSVLEASRERDAHHAASAAECSVTVRKTGGLVTHASFTGAGDDCFFFSPILFQHQRDM
jgi:hypothetical protein